MRCSRNWHLRAAAAIRGQMSRCPSDTQVAFPRASTPPGGDIDDLDSENWSGIRADVLVGPSDRTVAVTLARSTVRLLGGPRASQMAPPAGLEPATSSLEVTCSVQLSYGGSIAKGSGRP